MSPVSRGRMPKKGKQRSSSRPPAGRRSGGYVPPLPSQRTVFPTLVDLLGGPRERPGWFDPAIETVLGETGPLLAADGPRELEQAAAELLGGELERALHVGTGGLWFDWWLDELAGAVAGRAREALRDPDRDGWEAPWRLLHALTGLADPAIGQARLGQVKKMLPREVTARQPGWLRLLPKIAATGDVWEARDAYGGRIAVIAGFSYLDGAYPSAYLFDVDVCGFVSLAGAGAFDDVTQAASAWRARVGDSAAGARPVPVTDPGSLHCLVHWDGSGEMLTGDESRSYLDNWFRARRRCHEIGVVLSKRGTPLPDPRSRYRDREADADPLVEGFTAWYGQRYGVAPDPEAVEALAYEWVEGTVPGTEQVVAPERVRYLLALVGDWVSDEVTAGVRALLPDWVGWNGEQTGLPPELLDRALAVTAAAATA